MYEQVEKSKEKKSKPAANSVAQKKNGAHQGFGFVDNRPETVTQGKRQESVNQLQKQYVPPLQFAGHGKKRKGPKYIDPVKKPEIRHGGIPDPRAEVRKTLRIPVDRFYDPVVAIPRRVGDLAIEDALKSLPRTYRENPDVKRLLSEEDDAHKVYNGVLSNKKQEALTEVSQGRVREVLAAIEYAQQNKLPTSSIRSAKSFDFSIDKHNIDPFELPSSRDQGQEENYEQYLAQRGAYRKHTDGTKGETVIGVLDTTYSHPDEVTKMDRIREDGHVVRGSRFDVRVPLETEYIKDYINESSIGKKEYESLLAHRGSDPSRKWGPYDPGRQAINKAKYDKERKAREARLSVSAK